MASDGSAPRSASGARSFDFGSDDVLCSYDDYTQQLDKTVNGKRSDSSGKVEYYFSDKNIPNDVFLLKQVRKDKEGYVPITLISSFKKMKKLTKDLSLIEAALRTSSQVVVSSDGKRVKRLHPLPVHEVRDEKPRTVLVENLPEDYSEDSIRRIFGTAGLSSEDKISLNGLEGKRNNLNFIFLFGCLVLLGLPSVIRIQQSI